MSLSILAVDAATSCGWALQDRDGNVTSGVQVFALQRGESPGMRFLRFRRWLNEMTLGIGPCVGNKVQQPILVDVIAFEQGSHHGGGAATAVLVGLQTVILEEAARLGIETLPAHTSKVKKHATNKGNAGKPEMIAAAVKRWGRDPKTLGHDEADALCILDWAMSEAGTSAQGAS